MAKRPRQTRRGSSSARRAVRIARPSAPVGGESSKNVDFSQEYHYVVEDLKRIGVIALGLLVLLVVMAVAIG